MAHRKTHTKRKNPTLAPNHTSWDIFIHAKQYNIIIETSIKFK